MSKFRATINLDFDFEPTDDQVRDTLRDLLMEANLDFELNEIDGQRAQESQQSQHGSQKDDDKDYRVNLGDKCQGCGHEYLSMTSERTSPDDVLPLLDMGEG